MRLAKIKNRYLYKSDNPNGIHTYAVYYDEKTKTNNAVALTHLYIKDDKRFKQVKKGNIRVEKFKEFDVPSGVQNYYYSKTVDGTNIDLKNTDNVKFIGSRFLSKSRSERIKKFAKNNYNKKNSRK